MAALHLVFQHAGVAGCRAYVAPGDCVILLDAAADDRPLLAALPADVRIYIVATGAGEPAPPHVSIIGSGEFVALAASHDRVVSWD